MSIVNQPATPNAIWENNIGSWLSIVADAIFQTSNSPAMTVSRKHVIAPATKYSIVFFCSLFINVSVIWIINMKTPMTVMIPPYIARLGLTPSKTVNRVIPMAVTKNWMKPNVSFQIGVRKATGTS